MADQPSTPGNALTAPVQTGLAPGDSMPALVRRNVQVLRPIADAVVLVQVQNESRQLIASLLKDGRDFGTVPGVRKPSLLKPGAEKFNAAYGLVARFTVVEKEVDHFRQIDWTKTTKEWSGPKGQRRAQDKTVAGTSFGLYRYVINCDLVDRASGEIVGSSLGSCSTLESKYVDRPRDLENTVIKMAEKRAYIGATLLTHGLSEQFTQDVEDTGVASDDTQAVSVQPQDDQQNLPEVGSAEWAITYPIAASISKVMKLAAEVQTFGQLDWKQLEFIVAGMETLKAQKPDKAPACDEAIRAARRMQDELEERAALAEGDAAAESTATDLTGGVQGAPVDNTKSHAFSTPQQPPFKPMAADGGGVPAARSDAGTDQPQTADGQPVTDDLPF